MHDCIQMFMPQIKPIYEHDCTSCIFLGTILNDKDLPVDLYFCPKEPTILARFSSEGSDYTSGLRGLNVGQFPHERHIAYLLARQRKLIPHKYL